MIEINNAAKAKIDEKAVKRTAGAFLKKKKLDKKDVSIAFVSPREMRRLNRNYRKVDRTTDVLSFEGEEDFLGEIILDYSQIKKQAPENGKTAEEELLFILVHGLLHLAGYDDKTEKSRLEMIKLGEKFLKSLC